MKIAVIMGSVSDFDSLKEMVDFLKSMDVSVDIRALSAHRTPQELMDYLEKTDEENDLYIAAAGKAAHLPGVIASKTIKPVIGVPVKASTLDGLDALLSIVQMPKGIPVATVAIDGGLNAGILAVQILSLKYPALAQKLADHRRSMREEVLSKERELLAKIN
ncbi:MAG: 5-(carboxyamino)imidazole ribonucleotide mutase [Peptostreptococcaceae bacterium]|nr:5-(carboxyamino)imidazole ribonucleotide mutase [Peptostreptococcaceae bacterium]